MFAKQTQNKEILYVNDIKLICRFIEELEQIVWFKDHDIMSLECITISIHDLIVVQIFVAWCLEKSLVVNIIIIVSSKGS